MHLGSLESTQKARVALGRASSYSYAFFVLSKLSASIHNSIYAQLKARTLSMNKFLILGGTITFCESNFMTNIYVSHTKFLFPWIRHFFQLIFSGNRLTSQNDKSQILTWLFRSNWIIRLTKLALIASDTVIGQVKWLKLTLYCKTSISLHLTIYVMI